MITTTNSSNMTTNNTMLSSNGQMTFEPPNILDIPMLIFCIFLFTFGIVGNFFIIVFFVTKNKVKGMITYHIWIMLLAVSDFFTCTCGFALFVVIRDQQYFSLVLARASNVCMLVTIFSLCGVAYDRYRAIAKPFCSTNNHKTKTIFAYISMVLLAFMCEYVYTKMDHLIPNILHNLIFYSVVYTAIDCIIPVAFMIILYSRLSTKLDDVTKPLQEQTPKTSNALFKRNREALKIIKFLTAVYIINIVPVRVIKMTLEYCLYLNFWPQFNHEIVIAIQSMMLLLFTNNCINCLIYAGRMKEFRRFIIKLFKPWTQFDDRYYPSRSLRYTQDIVTQV